jgi:H+-transporting ATPase
MSEPNVEKEPGPLGEESPIAPVIQRKREYKEFGHEEEQPTRTLFSHWRVFRF